MLNSSLILISSLKIRKKLYNIPIIGLFLLLTSCDQTTNTEPIHQQDNALFKLQGCYTINKDEPALIKVSQKDDKWFMQTNDTHNKQYQWDTPEPLEVLTSIDSQQYFDIDPQYINATLARPDRLLVLSHTKPEFAHINMGMDSEFLAYIYKGSNTIYKINCDTISK